MFPADLAPPTFHWLEVQPACDTWELTFEFGDGLPPLQAQATSTLWSPDPASWETIKSRSKANPSRVVLRGFRKAAPKTTHRQASLEFTTSPDPVGAPIFYRDVNLPFLEAVKDPSDIRWRLGSVADPEPPGRSRSHARLRQLPFLLGRRPDPGHGRGLCQQQGLLRHHPHRAGNGSPPQRRHHLGQLPPRGWGN
ncbi:MAG: hypothetical protein M5U12_30230 [Verrucomicrobia bacterium]|nr:hypothetical protein [Verrucomicrobiota bacterium]